MVKVKFLPSGKEGIWEQGESVLDTAARAGVDIGQQCGGRGTCGKCRIRVGEGEVDAPTVLETERLSPEDLRDGIRLACQTIPVSDLRVEVLTQSGEILTTKTLLSTNDFEIDNSISSCTVTCSPPSLSDWRDDLLRLKEEISRVTGLKDTAIDPEVLKIFPETARKAKWSFTACMRGNEIIGITPEKGKLIGLAVDIGSTKLAGYLLNLSDGTLLASRGKNNPQRTYGSDIITRLSFALESDENREHLKSMVVGEINALGKQLCEEAGLSGGEILLTVLVGNTAMHHLFFGLPVRYLTEAPYVPVCTGEITLKGREAGLTFAPGSICTFLPNIAGFIGSDHVAMILSLSGHLEGGKTTLMLDVGTNTEICLYREGRMTSVSTPSGPAFEGGHIQCGMAAASGAIEGVSINGTSVSLEVIGGAEPAGICGSGIIDVIAELYREGIIDWRGRFQEHERVSEDKRFKLSENVYITQKDIQEFMLAKGAIGAGIAVLLDSQGVQVEDLELVVIAGAFGAHIDIKKAMAIGLFPRVPVDRYIQAGNAAGAGAVRALLSENQLAEAASIQKNVEYLELAVEEGFRDAYTKASFFPRDKG